jgi:sugar phosphate isomerase/epimerase
MTNTATKDAWAEVGDRLEALALKLKLHAKEELSEDGVTVRGALERLKDAVEDSVTAVSDACHDPAVRDDAREAVSSLARAITKTLDKP